MQKIAVVGSRAWPDQEFLYRKLDQVRRKVGDFCVVSGGARGADTMAQRWAEEQGLPVLIFLPEWEIHGRRAGFERNSLIVEAADQWVLAFQVGNSRGTRNTIELAITAGKQVVVYRKS